MKQLTIPIPRSIISTVLRLYVKFEILIVGVIATALSIYYFLYFYSNKLGLAYNDARSHLDIGRRVVEGLKPGMAQLGSVWLPLNHILMIPTIWNDYMWHSGLSGAIQSMISYIVCSIIIMKFLQKLRVGIFGRIAGCIVFLSNINILYLQSTAMTELLLLLTMTVGVYELVLWHEDNSILHLVKSALWIMMATLVRYDGWFLLGYACVLVFVQIWRTKGYKMAEGTTIAFVTLAGFGIFLWLVWNQLIFKDALYFALGPFSAHAQQAQMSKAGVLVTQSNLLLSLKVYLYALAFNAYTYFALLGLAGGIVLLFDTSIRKEIRISSTALLAPFFFNILALFLGFSVLFVQGISGDTWFNVRYGIMVMPSIAIYVGYLIDRLRPIRWVLAITILFVIFFSFTNQDAVTIDDARVGSSQKNVSEVAGFLNANAKNEKGFILISAASHDAIIFSSGLPMKRFIHEGTGKYWESAISMPDQWARWIITRTYDDNDLTWRSIKNTPGIHRYTLKAHYPFADVYQIKDEYLPYLKTEPVYGKQR